MMTVKLLLKSWVWGVMISWALAVAAPVWGQEAALTNIIVTNTRDHLLLYLNVEGAFTEDVEKAVLSGVPTSFSFSLSIYRKRNLWLDEKIADITATHTLKYNNLKKEFVVSRSWEKGKPIVTSSLEKARQLMNDIESLQLVPLDRLEKGRRYQVKAKAELSKMTMPLYLHHVLFFMSLWDVETDWYTIDFTY